MSAINQALSDLGKHNQSNENQPPLIKAEIKEVRRTGRARVLFSAVTLSLLIGGWAVSSTLNQVDEKPLTQVISDDDIETMSFASIDSIDAEVNTINSPTHRQVSSEVEIYDKPELVINKQSLEEQKAVSEHTVAISEPKKIAAPILVATVEKSSKPKLSPVITKKSMSVQQVKLMPSELATKAISRAEKALEANDSVTAINAYSAALRYVPSDEVSRMKISALLYGKNQLQEAVKVLQKGIKRDNDSVKLRYALAQLLVKEKQPQAALSVLEYIPLNATTEYIALRGAIAQQINYNDLAIESYRILVNKEPENGRWWLGFAISLERQGELDTALNAYKKSMLNAGLSSNSQAFARDRLALLSTHEVSINEETP